MEMQLTLTFVPLVRVNCLSPSLFSFVPPLDTDLIILVQDVQLQILM